MGSSTKPGQSLPGCKAVPAHRDGVGRERMGDGGFANNVPGGCLILALVNRCRQQCLCSKPPPR